MKHIRHLKVDIFPSNPSFYREGMCKHILGFGSMVQIARFFVRDEIVDGGGVCPLAVVSIHKQRVRDLPKTLFKRNALVGGGK